MENMKERMIEELVILLLYLTGWEEKVDTFDMEEKRVIKEKVIRSWKGYPFDTLNSLSEKGYITDSRRAKSVYLTEEGAKKAEELKKKYLGE